MYICTTLASPPSPKDVSKGEREQFLMRGGKEKGKGNENSFNRTTFLSVTQISAHSSVDKYGKFDLKIKQRSDLL